MLVLKSARLMSARKTKPDCPVCHGEGILPVLTDVEGGNLADLGDSGPCPCTFDDTEHDEVE